MLRENNERFTENLREYLIIEEYIDLLRANKEVTVFAALNAIMIVNPKTTGLKTPEQTTKLSQKLYFQPYYQLRTTSQITPSIYYLPIVLITDHII